MMYPFKNTGTMTIVFFLVLILVFVIFAKMSNYEGAAGDKADKAAKDKAAKEKADAAAKDKAKSPAAPPAKSPAAPPAKSPAAPPAKSPAAPAVPTTTTSAQNVNVSKYCNSLDIKGDPNYNIACQRMAGQTRASVPPLKYLAPQYKPCTTKENIKDGTIFPKWSGRGKDGGKWTCIKDPSIPVPAPTPSSATKSAPVPATKK